MPTFHYTAKRGPKDVVEGVIEAENRSGALTQLSQLGYTPVRVLEQAGALPDGPAGAPASAPAKATPSPMRVRRVPHGQLTTFTRQFASLVRSQVPLLRALKILEDQARHPALRAVLHEMTEAVRQGQTLSSSMGQFPGVFSPLYVNLIHSGEISGALDTILERLAEEAEREEVLRAKIRAAMTYPAFVAIVGCGTVVFLMTFVMPRFTRLLTGLGERLPLPTRLLLTGVEWMTSWWFWGVVLGVAIGMTLLVRGFSDQGRALRDRLLLRLPVIGPFIQQLEVARFARAFGLLVDHGVPILRAVDVATPIVGNRSMREQFARIPEGLRQGALLSACLKQLPAATPFLVNTIAVGEESGAVGGALTEVARYYEREAERMLQVLSTLLEPLLIVIVGVVVGFIVMAVLLPVFEMSTINL